MCDELNFENNPNPWAAIKDGNYVLENEKEAAQNKQYKFHTDLPPQPFQGNPDAPIWILALNPGYSEKTDKDPVPDVWYYKNHEERRKAMLNQLKFKKSGKHWHYVLDNEDGNYSKEWFKKHFFKDMGIDENNVEHSACSKPVYSSEESHNLLKGKIVTIKAKEKHSLILSL